MKYDKDTLVSAWRRRSCQDLNAAVLLHEQGDLSRLVYIASQKDAEFESLESLADLSDMAVAGRYPESDQWIVEYDVADWIITVRNACDFIWSKCRVASND
jgi:hypothetical protein